MSDTTHWIFVPDDRGEPKEITEETLIEQFSFYSNRVHLVPGRVWRDYLAARHRHATVREELTMFNRPALVAHATRKGKERIAEPKP